MDLVNKFILGLDYEIFFGSESGTIEKCLIEPVDALLRVCERTGLKLTLFVDCGYLIKLRSISEQHAELARGFSRIKENLRKVSESGHDLQLHVHPHWIDTDYEKGQWRFSYEHYRLHTLDVQQRYDLIAEQKALLEEIAQNDVFAYRAGGWCLQPFDEIGGALRESNIWLDSTVYGGGFNPEPNRYFDFRGAPNEPSWRFEDDPLVQASGGYFVEIPISRIDIPPHFFWRMAIYKKVLSKRLQTFGDGEALGNEGRYYIKRLISSTTSPVSIDGIKARLLDRAYNVHIQGNPTGVFNVMGHPKSLTTDSLLRLEEFLKKHTELIPVRARDFKELSNRSSTT